MFISDSDVSPDDVSDEDVDRTIAKWASYMGKNKVWGDGTIIQAFCNIYVYGIILVNTRTNELQLFEPKSDCISDDLIDVYMDSQEDSHFNNLDRYKVLCYNGRNHYETVTPYNLHPTYNLLHHMRTNNAAAASSLHGHGGTILFLPLLAN